MRTSPTETGFTAEHSVQLGVLARNIHMTGEQVWSILEQYGTDRAPVLIKVLQSFQDGFCWAKVGALLHSDKELALSMIQKVASDLGQVLPAKPMMDSHRS